MVLLAHATAQLHAMLQFHNQIIEQDHAYSCWSVFSGATCYLNALVQVLSKIPQFWKLIMTIDTATIDPNKPVSNAHNFLRHKPCALGCCVAAMVQLCALTASLSMLYSFVILYCYSLTHLMKRTRFTDILTSRPCLISPNECSNEAYVCGGWIWVYGLGKRRACSSKTVCYSGVKW